MENQRSREQQSEQQQTTRRNGAQEGFEGMNFEEQRGPVKNSDGAGHRYDRMESMKQRNGKSAPNE